MKLLIDECLSPELAQLARSRGHGESSHVVWLNKGGWKDWSLKSFILEGDWTFVTTNAIDFRGPASEPGSRWQYAEVAIHADLPHWVGRPESRRSMRSLRDCPQVLEVTLDEDGAIQC
jgi:hypothetical protein